MVCRRNVLRLKVGMTTLTFGALTAKTPVILVSGRRILARTWTSHRRFVRPNHANSAPSLREGIGRIIHLSYTARRQTRGSHHAHLPRPRISLEKANEFGQQPRVN